MIRILSTSVPSYSAFLGSPNNENTPFWVNGQSLSGFASPPRLSINYGDEEENLEPWSPPTVLLLPRLDNLELPETQRNPSLKPRTPLRDITSRT